MGIQVYSGLEDAKHIPTVTKSFESDSDCTIGDRRVKVYKVPCHTRGHTIFHFVAHESEGGEELGE